MPTTQLSPHFTLAEMIYSDTAARRSIDNTPSPDIVENLRRLCIRLEEVRQLLGHPMIISSGYRCLALNRAIGSSDTSAHVKGLACDFTCPGFGDPKAICDAIIAHGIKFDQVIWEYGSWCHFGLATETERMMALTIDGGGTRYGIA